MNDGARYIEIVERFDEDGCFVGSCPGVIGRWRRGEDEVEASRELCRIVDEWLENARREDGALPRPTAGRDAAGFLAA